MQIRGMVVVLKEPQAYQNIPKVKPSQNLGTGRAIIEVVG